MVDHEEREAEQPPEEDEFGLVQLTSDDDQGLSLDELSRTYAELINRGSDPYVEPEAPAEISQPPPPEDDDDDPCEITPRSILEAMLFVGHPENESLTSRDVAGLMRGVRPSEVDDLVVELNEIYDSLGSPYTIVSVGAGYQMRLRDEFATVRNKFYGRVKAAHLSQPAVEVLAVVAYNQPITRPEVDRLRGKPSGALLSQLVRRQLLALNRPEDKPRVPIYNTTDRFLDIFGMDNISELPRSQDVERDL